MKVLLVFLRKIPQYYSACGHNTSVNLSEFILIVIVPASFQ